jgi:hypothetical protein
MEISTPGLFITGYFKGCDWSPNLRVARGADAVTVIPKGEITGLLAPASSGGNLDKGLTRDFRIGGRPA